MAVGYVGTTLSAGGDAEDENFSPTIHGHNTGDFLAVQVCTTSGSLDPTHDSPAGWDHIGYIDDLTGSREIISLYTKIAESGSETLAITSTVGANQQWDCSASTFTGIDEATAEVSATGHQTSGVDVTCPTVTSLTNGALLIYVMTQSGGAGQSLADIYSDAGFNGIGIGWQQNAFQGTGQGMAISYKILGDAGATGTCVFSTLVQNGAAPFITAAFAAGGASGGGGSTDKADQSLFFKQ